MALFSLNGVVYQDIIRYPDIQISAGEATFICGESGSGKSTLLKLLNGILSPSSGCIRYSGKDVEGWDSIELRRDVLLVSQSVFLFDKSIRDNFNEYYAYRELPFISDDVMRSYLDICCTDLPLDTSCAVMSGGERQRVFVAINLSYNPKVFMMDEPTSALDERNSNALISGVKQYCKENGISMLVVSHDMGVAGEHADRLITLGGGR